MIEINDRFMNFGVGWIVEYMDGTSVYEGEKDWREIPKKGIKSLSLKWHDKLWSITGKENYLQFKRGFVTLSVGSVSNNHSLSERCIGYYDEKGRKIIYKVNDITGDMKLEVKEG